ncbi:DUF4333 domain-containing protein [Amycolatopsis orientalis]|uniref:DUF4333 domain-containing protein n=1 Tax=Amycolatopsis orientalis TaxID=31958 RepID=UPI0003A3965E|nr:DUF4333 domain-containing protein [Amycolatopsis orientalis]
MRIRPVLLAACAFLLAGCSVSVSVGKQVSKEDLERGISDALQQSIGKRPDTVTCPGAIKAVEGESMRCVLTAGGQKVGLTAKIGAVHGSDVRYNVQVDQKPMN